MLKKNNFILFHCTHKIILYSHLVDFKFLLVALGGTWLFEKIFTWCRDQFYEGQLLPKITNNKLIIKYVVINQLGVNIKKNTEILYQNTNKKCIQ